VVTGAERQDLPKADPKGGRGGDHQPRHERNHRFRAPNGCAPEEAQGGFRWLRSCLAAPPANFSATLRVGKASRSHASASSLTSSRTNNPAKRLGGLRRLFWGAPANWQRRNPARHALFEPLHVFNFGLILETGMDSPPQAEAADVQRIPIAPL